MVCRFIPSEDRRRKLFKTRMENLANNLSAILESLLQVLREGTDEDVQNLRLNIQQNVSEQNIIADLKKLLG